MEALFIVSHKTMDCSKRKQFAPSSESEFLSLRVVPILPRGALVENQ